MTPRLSRFSKLTDGTYRKLAGADVLLYVVGMDSERGRGLLDRIRQELVGLRGACYRRH
jgi:hypothetical protein